MRKKILPQTKSIASDCDVSRHFDWSKTAADWKEFFDNFIKIELKTSQLSNWMMVKEQKTIFADRFQFYREKVKL